MSATASTTASAAALAGIRRLLSAELAALDQVIIERLRSDVALIESVGRHIVAAGGKRLRPIVALLSARALGAGDATAPIEAAAVVEFIHTATLLHDDVVDGAALRRGRPTANHVWGNQAAVLVGDFLYSRAFEMMVSIGDMRVMEIMAEATNTIARGEVKQLVNKGDTELTEERYLDVIYCKTAKLFEAAAQIGAVLAGRPEAAGAMMAYGRHLGVAYQLIDDVLDYAGGDDAMGKAAGIDLAEGKSTLPAIHCLGNGRPEQAALVRQALAGSDVPLAEVRKAIESAGGIAYTSRLARAEARRAAEALAEVPPSPYRDALVTITGLAVDRDG